MAPFLPRISESRPVCLERLNIGKNWDHSPYSGVKQHTDRRYAVPIYDDWLDLLKSLPMGVKSVATIVPVDDDSELAGT